jgi:hypothetical protein
LKFGFIGLTWHRPFLKAFVMPASGGRCCKMNKIEQLKNTIKIRILNLAGLTRIIAISLMIGLFVASCEDPYLPQLDAKYDKMLVVEGTISNAPPPYTIKLSLSSNMQKPEYLALSDYNVAIVDDHGNEEVLAESGPGTYLSSADGMQGIVGRKYKIALQSPEGKIYSSDFVELREPVGIQSVYAKVEYKQSQTRPFEIPGYQFYIDTYLGQNDSTFFLWSMVETYKFESDYLIFFYFDGVLHVNENSDSLKTCWHTEKVYSFFIENTMALSEPRLTNYPLSFVDTKTRRLSIRYSLLVDQYTISAGAYQYWNAVKEQNTETGGLYTRQPYQLRGNVYNTSDNNEQVLGYFMVAGVSQKRIFVNRPEATVRMYYPICELWESDYRDYQEMFLGSTPDEWPLFVTEDARGIRALPNQKCIDCTQKGGVLEKPDFWVDY